MLALDPEVADPNLRLHGVRLVHDDERRVGTGGSATGTGGISSCAQLPNTRSAPANASSAVMSPTTARIEFDGP